MTVHASVFLKQMPVVPVEFHVLARKCPHFLHSISMKYFSNALCLHVLYVKKNLATQGGAFIVSLQRGILCPVQWLLFSVFRVLSARCHQCFANIYTSRVLPSRSDRRDAP